VEAARILLMAGYGVVMMDARAHGLSERATGEVRLAGTNRYAYASSMRSKTANIRGICLR
jgi:alpha-beta hydrolase superfamily lysophospholipase